MRYLFDLDGTITREELLPRISRALGLEKEISELTRQTIAGEIPFENSFRKRVEILSRLPVSAIREIVAGVELDPHLVAFMRANRENCAIVTGNLDVWISDLCADLAGRVYCSTARCADDYIVGLEHVLDKGTVAESVPSPFAAVGDGHNDCGMLKRADVSVAYGGVHNPAPALLDIADYAIFDSRPLCSLLAQL